MLRLSDKGNSFSIITKLILINSIVFIFIFIFLIVNNVYTKNNLNKEITNIYKLNLNHVSNKIEKSLKDIKYFIYMQREDNKLISNSLINTYDKETILYLRELKNQITKLQEVVPFIKQISIHFINFKKVVNDGGVRDTDVFCNEHKDINLAMIKDFNVPTLIVNEGIYYAFTYNNIQIIIEVDKDQLLKSFYPSINYLSKNEIFILDKNDNIMLSTLPKIQFKHIKHLVEKKEEINLNDTSYNILSIDFEEGKCYLLYDTLTTSKRLRDVNKYTVIILLFFVLMNLFVILYNMKAFVIPMNAIVTDITTLYENNNKNQIQVISNTIKNLQQTNTEMKVQLESQTNVVQHNILLKIITKQNINSNEIKILNQLQTIFKRYVFVSSIIEDMNGEKDFDIINKYKKYMESNFNCKSILYHSIYNTFIISCEEVNCIDILSQISKFASKYNKTNFILFGLSAVHNDIDEMSDAFNQSRVAMYRQTFNDKNYNISCYVDIKNKLNNKIILSLSEEQQLTSNVINGNYDAVTNFFNKEIKNKLKKTSYKQIYNFYNNLINLLQIILNAKDINLQELYPTEITIITNSKNISIINENIRELYIDVVKTYFYKTNETYELIVQYILDNYDSDISIEIIADQIHLTPNYIARCFKQNTGLTIKKYIDQVRIEKAKELMQKYPNLKIEDIGIKVGISSINTFIRLFKKYTGLTPGQYKKTI